MDGVGSGHKGSNYLQQWTFQGQDTEAGTKEGRSIVSAAYVGMGAPHLWSSKTQSCLHGPRASAGSAHSLLLNPGKAMNHTNPDMAYAHAQIYT